MRSNRVSLAALAASLAATLALGFGLARAAEDGAEPCGSPVPSVEGPAFDPENVCRGWTSRPAAGQDVQGPGI